MSIIKMNDGLSKITKKKAKQIFEIYLVIDSMSKSNTKSVYDGDQSLISWGSSIGLNQYQTSYLFKYVKEFIKQRKQKEYLWSS